MTAKKLTPNQTDLHTVLILSQDADMTRVWKMLFEQRNCHVISESNSHDGLSTAHLISPTLVIIDMDLPHSECLELCRKLRSTTNGTLLLLNSSHKNINILEYHRAGVDETIVDSISPMALLIKSLAWLARQDWIVPRRSSAQIWA